MLKRRPGLTQCLHRRQLGFTQVSELLFEGRTCVGVKALVAGRTTEFRSKEVILSCGAIHSPAHLLRSGIGPGHELTERGIPVRAHRLSTCQKNCAVR